MENTAQAENEQKYKRYLKNFLIYPRYQLALVIINVLVLLAGFIIIYYQVGNSFYNLDEIAAAKNIMTNPYYKELVLIQEKLILTQIFTTIIICLTMTVLFTILFSHKSAGAIYGLQKYFQDIAKNGYTKPLTFRKGDMHEQIPTAVNAALAKIMNEKK